MDIEELSVPNINYETDKEVTSSDESFCDDKEPYYYTRFKIRDHIKAFFTANEAVGNDKTDKLNDDTNNSWLSRTPQALISCSATKMVMNNYHDYLVMNHLRYERRFKRRSPYDSFPSQWNMWIQRGPDDDRERFGSVINDRETFEAVLETVRSKQVSYKKLHILRAEMTPDTRTNFSDSSIFMRVKPSKEFACYGRLASLILSNGFSQPFEANVGIAMIKTTEEYSLLIVWLANGHEESEGVVHDTLTRLTGRLEESDLEVLRTSIFVRRANLAMIPIFSEYTDLE